MLVPWTLVFCIYPFCPRIHQTCTCTWYYYKLAKALELIVSMCALLWYLSRSIQRLHTSANSLDVRRQRATSTARLVRVAQRWPQPPHLHPAMRNRSRSSLGKAVRSPGHSRACVGVHGWVCSGAGVWWHRQERWYMWYTNSFLHLGFVLRLEYFWHTVCAETTSS